MRIYGLTREACLRPLEKNGTLRMLYSAKKYIYLTALVSRTTKVTNETMARIIKNNILLTINTSLMANHITINLAN